MDCHLESLVRRHPDLETIRPQIEKVFHIWKAAYDQGKKTLVCGNGGSAADSDHIVGELMKGFESKRAVSEQFSNQLKELYGTHGDYLAKHLQQALPAISLVSQTALMTAFANDVAPEMVFAQQVLGYGQDGDVLIAISTSGNADNVVYAVEIAKAIGLRTIGFTGKSGGRLKELCDEVIIAPGATTAHIQEKHIAIYHTLCLLLEDAFFRS